MALALCCLLAVLCLSDGEAVLAQASTQHAPAGKAAEENVRTFQPMSLLGGPPAPQESAKDIVNSVQRDSIQSDSEDPLPADDVLPTQDEVREDALVEEVHVRRNSLHKAAQQASKVAPAKKASDDAQDFIPSPLEELAGLPPPKKAPKTYRYDATKHRAQEQQDKPHFSKPKVFRYDATKSHHRDNKKTQHRHVATYHYDATKKHHRAAAAPKKRSHVKKASQLASAIPKVSGDSVQVFTPAPLSLNSMESRLEAPPPAPKHKKVKEYHYDPTQKRREAARKRRAAQRAARRAAKRKVATYRYDVRRHRIAKPYVMPKNIKNRLNRIQAAQPQTSGAAHEKKSAKKAKKKAIKKPPRRKLSGDDILAALDQEADVEAESYKKDEHQLPQLQAPEAEKMVQYIRNGNGHLQPSNHWVQGEAQRLTSAIPKEAPQESFQERASRLSRSIPQEPQGGTGDNGHVLASKPLEAAHPAPKPVNSGLDHHYDNKINTGMDHTKKTPSAADTRPVNSGLDHSADTPVPAKKKKILKKKPHVLTLAEVRVKEEDDAGLAIDAEAESWTTPSKAAEKPAAQGSPDKWLGDGAWDNMDGYEDAMMDCQASTSAEDVAVDDAKDQVNAAALGNALASARAKAGLEH